MPPPRGWVHGSDVYSIATNPTVRLRKVDQFPALTSAEMNEQTRTLAWKQVRPRSSVNNDEIEPESTDDRGYDFARAVGSCRPSALRSRPIHHRTGADQMNDVYIIKSWFGERLNKCNVHARQIRGRNCKSNSMIQHS
jgi:hypothetical protein